MSSLDTEIEKLKKNLDDTLKIAALIEKLIPHSPIVSNLENQLRTLNGVFDTLRKNLSK